MYMHKLSEPFKMQKSLYHTDEREFYVNTTKQNLLYILSSLDLSLLRHEPRQDFTFFTDF